MATDGTSESPFVFGVASGDVSHGDVVLWAKLAKPGGSATWHLEPADGDGAGQTGEATSDPVTGSIHVKVDGLEAGEPYRYWFESDGGTSTIGHFKTIPTDRPVRFAVVSCAKYNSGFFNAYRAVAELDDIDFVLHLGDYIYEAAQIPTGKQTPGADIGRPMDPLGDCMTREDYDRRYALYRGDADLALLHSRHAMMATIDDHELSDNAWLGGAQEHEEEHHGPWIDRSNAAMNVWSDWMPTLRHPAEGDPIWQEIDLGEAGRILLGETRLSRSHPDDPRTPDKTALGLKQREFFLDRITTPHSGWTFVALPSMLSDLDAAVADKDALFALHKLKMAEADEPESFHDLWDSYDYEQDAIMDAAAAADRTVVLSGDVHFSAEHVNRLRTGGEYIEWTVTSVTSANLDDKMGWPRGTESKNYEAAMIRMLPDMKWCDLDSHGFVVIESSTRLVSCQWWFVDEVLTISDGITMGREVVLPTRPEGTAA
jgi:alkaline phosphatase D